MTERRFNVTTPDRVHVPDLERAAYNQMPKHNGIRDLRLLQYVGTDLYQWFGKEKDSVFEDPLSDPFQMVEQGAEARSDLRIVAWVRKDNRSIVWWGAEYPVHWEEGEGRALYATDAEDLAIVITVEAALRRDSPTIQPPPLWYDMDSIPTHGRRIWVVDADNVATILYANPEFRGCGSLNYSAWAPLETDRVDA